MVNSCSAPELFYRHVIYLIRAREYAIELMVPPALYTEPLLTVHWQTRYSAGRDPLA